MARELSLLAVAMKIELTLTAGHPLVGRDSPETSGLLPANLDFVTQS